MSHILQVNDIEYSKITYTKPEKKGSFYYSSIGYNVNEKTQAPFYIQTPKMKSLSIGSDILDKKNTVIMTKLNNNDLSMYDCLLNIDQKNISETFKNSSEWFGKELTSEIIQEMYKSNIKAFSKDKDPTLNFKLPIIKNNIECTIYDQQRNYLTIDAIQPDVDVILIIHIKGLKFLKQHYYCEYYISQIKVCNDNLNYHVLQNYMMEDKEEDMIFENEIIDEEVVLSNFQKQVHNKKLTDEINEKQQLIEITQKEIVILKSQLYEL